MHRLQQLGADNIERIEVIRGPAALLYGANAIGGLVNVITDEIPTRPQTGVGGNFTFDLGSAARQGGAAEITGLTRSRVGIIGGGIIAADVLRSGARIQEQHTAALTTNHRK